MGRRKKSDSDEEINTLLKAQEDVENMPAHPIWYVLGVCWMLLVYTYYIFSGNWLMNEIVRLTDSTILVILGFVLGWGYFFMAHLILYGMIAEFYNRRIPKN